MVLPMEYRFKESVYLPTSWGLPVALLSPTQTLRSVPMSITHFKTTLEQLWDLWPGAAFGCINWVSATTSASGIRKPLKCNCVCVSCTNKTHVREQPAVTSSQSFWARENYLPHACTKAWFCFPVALQSGAQSAHRSRDACLRQHRMMESSGKTQVLKVWDSHRKSRCKWPEQGSNKEEAFVWWIFQFLPKRGQVEWSLCFLCFMCLPLLSVLIAKAFKSV